MDLGPLLCADRRSRMSGRRPDVRGFTRGRMSGLAVQYFCSLWIGGVGCPAKGPDFRAFGRSRMSGARGRMSGPCSTSTAGLLLLLASSGAGCPGPWPDVWGLGDALGSFHWLSSSVDLGTCPSSCASSGGPSWYLIMHNISDLGSSHVSCIESGSSERSEFTLSSIALARARVIGPSGVVGGVGAPMGMIMGCSASSPLPWGRL